MSKRAQVLPRMVDFARRHGGVITRPQALAQGANDRLLSEVVREGLFLRRHAGVYVLAGSPNDHGLAVRAALAAVADRDAMASHASAAWLQDLIDRPPAEVHLTRRGDDKRPRGVVVHRSLTTGALHRRPFQGVMCTLPARTLVDYAATATPAQLADAIDRALSHGIVRTRDLVAEIEGNAGRRGTELLRRSLTERGLTEVPTPSVLESRMARLFHRFGLPEVRPEVVAGNDGEYRIDYAYVPSRVMVELYGYTWHHSPEQMTADHARQRRLTLQGWTVLIFTWPDVTRRPAMVARAVRAALRGAAPRPTAGPTPA